MSVISGPVTGAMDDSNIVHEIGLAKHDATECGRFTHKELSDLRRESAVDHRHSLHELANLRRESALDGHSSSHELANLRVDVKENTIQVGKDIWASQRDNEAKNLAYFIAAEKQTAENAKVLAALHSELNCTKEGVGKAIEVAGKAGEMAVKAIEYTLVESAKNRELAFIEAAKARECALVESAKVRELALIEAAKTNEKIGMIAREVAFEGERTRDLVRNYKVEDLRFANQELHFRNEREFYGRERGWDRGFERRGECDRDFVEVRREPRIFREEPRVVEKVVERVVERDRDEGCGERRHHRETREEFSFGPPTGFKVTNEIC